jgi:cobalt-zinc-cadmium efflux system outer membrane protein
MMTIPLPVALPPTHSKSIDPSIKQSPQVKQRAAGFRPGALGAGLVSILLSLSVPIALAENSAVAEVKIVTVDELVSTVLQHNTGLNAARRAIDIATAGITTASAYPNPRLELNGGRGSAITPGTTSGNIVGVGVSQLIENPALRSARINSALFAEQGSQQAYATTRNELVGLVRLRTNEYLLRKLQAREAAESLSLLEQIRERIKVRVETGETGKLDLIRADAEIINARQREETARLQIAQSAITLNRLAAGMLPARWELEGNLEETRVLPALDQLKSEAVQFNPEVRLLEAELDRTKSRVEEAAASVIPSVELRASQLREPDLRNDMIGLSVQIPILDQRRGPKAEAAAERERTRGRLEGRRAELLQQLELSRRAVDIATVRVKALSEGAVRSSEAALRVAEAAYRFGERGILEVLDAQRVLRAIRQDLLLARYELQSALIELDVLTGRYAAEK